MRKTGIIVRKDKDKVFVQIDRTGECGDKCESCSASCDIPKMEVKVDNILGAKVGDYVSIVAKERSLISSSFILYTVPLIAFIIGVVLGVKISAYYMLSEGELVGLGIGFLSLLISYLIIKFSTRNMNELIHMESKYERFDS